MKRLLSAFVTIVVVAVMAVPAIATVTQVSSNSLALKQAPRDMFYDIVWDNMYDLCNTDVPALITYANQADAGDSQTNPIATASWVETGGLVRKIVGTLSSVPIVCTTENPTTNSMGGTKILDFDEARWLILGVTVADLTTATNKVLLSTNLVSYSLGTTAAAKPGLITTAVNFAPTNTLTQATNYNDVALASSAQFDGTSTAVDLYINMTCETQGVTNYVSGGPITIYALDLGNY